MQTLAPDAEGFIRNWLVLAPMAMDGESGASEIERELLAGEATLTPKAGDKVSVGGKALSTNDQGRAWLNGKPVFRFVDTRTLEKDSDRVDVTLAKGQNVLVLKVVNEVNNWQACARFLRNGAPATDLGIAVAPAGK